MTRMTSAVCRGVLFFCLASLHLGLALGEAKAEDLTLEIKLIWASNDPKSPDPKHKKLDSELTKWLEKQLKWKHYYEENVQHLTLHGSAVSKVQMSADCRLEIVHLGNSRIEVKLYGKDKLVNKVVHTLPKNDRLIQAGDAKSDTAWFVSIKRAPKK